MKTKQLLLASLVIFLSLPMLAMESNCDCGESLLKQLKLDDQTPPTLQEALDELLIRAAEEDSIEKVRFELESGANPNSIGGFCERTPLMEAIHLKNKPMCELLLAYGADVSLPKNTGHTAMDFAAASKDLSLCSLVITQATFNCPRPSLMQQKKSHTLIFDILLTLHRVCPLLPRDIRYMILNATPDLQQHLMHTAFGIHRSHPERVPFLPIRVVQKLIHGTADTSIVPRSAAINALARHNSSILKPLCDDARYCTHEEGIYKFLDPEKFDEYFGAHILDHIKKRLDQKC